MKPNRVNSHAAEIAEALGRMALRLEHDRESLADVLEALTALNDMLSDMEHAAEAEALSFDVLVNAKLLTAPELRGKGIAGLQEALANRRKLTTD